MFARGRGGNHQNAAGSSRGGEERNSREIERDIIVTTVIADVS
jgi:hypothetical protein